MNDQRLLLGFAGTPQLAACFLRDLLAWDAAKVLLVYTRPDPPRWRGGEQRRLGPVKELALRHGLPVLQPTRAAQFDPEPLRRLDVLLVAAYGLLLPTDVLQAPRLGCVNLHFSLLPRWRGAAPIAHALLAGDEESGISLIRMDERLDTGPLLCQESCPIGPQDTAGSLEQRLAALGAPCVRETLLALREGRLRPRPQEQAQACYAPRLDKEQARLDWEKPAALLERQVRAYHPRPGAYMKLASEATAGRRLKIHRAVVVASEAHPGSNGPPAPGAVIRSGKEGIDILAGDGKLLRLLEVQPEGRRRMPAAAFWRGWSKGSKLLVNRSR